jgi:hypothetical protein
MASLTRLLRGGSMVPDGAGGFTFKLDSKFKWDTAKLKKKIGAANAKALQRAGMDVRKAAQKGMSSRTPKAPRQWRIAQRHGFNLVALVTRVPKPDVVTSWRTSRNPKGELRQSIESDYDYGRQSVAIGPSASRMRPAVNKILEFGGTTTHYFVPVQRNPPGRRRNTIYGRLSNSRPRIRGTRVEQTGLYSFTRSVKGRGFMAKGLAKALPKIPERYRNTVTGP